jgi:outer membrane receptor protein involved in Fe transport
MKKILFLRELLTAFITLFICTVQAQNLTDTLNLDETLVLESTRIPLSLHEVSGSVSTLNRKQLQAPMARTLPEAMMGLPGVFVQRTNMGGGAPFLRGLSGNQVLLVVDGIRLNNAIYRYGPVQYLNTISLFDVNRVECYRGSGSVNYGSDALGGTIHVVSEKPDYHPAGYVKPLVDLRYDLPSGEKSASAGLQLGNKHLAGTARLTYRDFADVKPGMNKPVQTPSGYQETSANAMVRYQNGQSEWITGHQYFNQSNIPLYHRYALEGFNQYIWPEQGRQLHYLRLIQQGKTAVLKANIAYGSQWESRQYRKKASDPLTLEKDKVNSLHFNLESARKNANNVQATWLFESYRDFVQSSRTKTDSNGKIDNLRGLYPDRSAQSNLAVAYLLHKTSQTWIFETGVRFSMNRIEIPEATAGGFSDWQPAYSGRASAGKNMGKCFVYTAVNTGYRVPNIDDFGSLGLVDFRYEQPAYNLLPERNINAELGTRINSQRMKLHFVLFSNQLYGLISRVKKEGVFQQGVQVYEKMNTDRAHVWGAEISVDASLGKNWLLKGQGSWQQGDIVRPRSEPMRRIPPINGTFSIQHTGKTLLSGFELMGAGYQDRLAPGDISDNRIGPDGTPAWLIANIWTEFSIRHQHTLRISMQNIGNAYYKTHGSGIWMPGRTLRVSFRF